MWVIPDEAGISPGYQQSEIDADRLRGGLVTVASGIPGHDAAITLHNRNAALHVARLGCGDTVERPRRPTCMCSLRAAGSPSRESATSSRAMRHGSPTPTAGV